MAIPNTIEVMKKLETSRGSRVISYVTGNRQPANLFPTKMALDILEIFYEHLENFGKTKKISLVLHTNGGNLDTPWPLVNLIREYCKDFEVLVPRAAKSAGTLTALGANRIVMTPVSYLSPIDPAGTYQHEGKTQNIQVEDVLGFVDFAKERVGLNDQSALKDLLKDLVSQIPPTQIGSINRTLSLIRRLARNMLALHLKDINYRDRVDSIVEHLTQKLFSHSHLINRHEAKNLVGFDELIEYAHPRTHEKMDHLIGEYFSFMQEFEPFNPANELGGKPAVNIVVNRAIVDSVDFSNVYEGHYEIKKIKDQISVNTTFQGWKKTIK